MPLPMVHLYMAKKVQNYLNKEFGDYFYLGSIAPDAIHTRKGTNRKDKHKTHLFVKDSNEEKSWEITEKNILEFFKKDNPGEDDNIKFFRYGYSIHILLDMLWIKNIFQPFERALRSGGLNFDDIRRLYYDETKACDFMLYRENKWMDDILSRFSGIDEFDFYDVLSKEEIRAWKNVVINKIRNPVNNYLVEPSYIKVDTITGFIDKLVPAIASLI